MVTPSAGDLCRLEWVQLDGELHRKRASCDTLGNGGEWRGTKRWPGREKFCWTQHSVDGRNLQQAAFGCTKPCKWWDIYHINWCRIPSINSINLIFLDLWNWYTSNQENITYICWQFGSVWYICLVRYDNMKIKFQQTMVPRLQGDRILAARLARSTSTPFRHHRLCSLSLSLA